ncbi:Per1-like-domain-containing protein [Sporodiniella umbellata]|nr:Per1-like-domain-containing protein [Sporodiniella umbellata]
MTTSNAADDDMSYSTLSNTLVCLTEIILASSGDRLPYYISCVNQCAVSTRALPLNLRLLGWNAVDECKYECMQKITHKALESGDKIHQYHGKWPFIRVFGIQELASVIFSVLNGFMHYKYFFRIKRQITDAYPLKTVYLGIAVCGMNAWFWSTVFHTRDLPWTEKLDYFSAGLYILYGLFLSVVRIFNVLAYLLHVIYLTRLPRFDYGYNMLACLIVGGIQTSFWLVCGMSVILVSLAMSLEVFDFPPWFGLLDAHSLWHAATIPLAPLFYHFLLKDAHVESSTGRKQEKQKW